MDEFLISVAKQAPSIFILGVVSWQLWKDRKEHEKVMLALVREMVNATNATAARLDSIDRGVNEVHQLMAGCGHRGEASGKTQRIRAAI